MIIRLAAFKDLEFIESLDQHLSKEMLVHKMNMEHIFILTENDMPKGFLRFGYFWDVVPFVNLIYVKSDQQHKGYGRALMNHFEQNMKSKGHTTILTSTMANEFSQYFYRKLGYEDCGSFLIEPKGFELLLKKTL